MGPRHGLYAVNASEGFEKSITFLDLFYHVVKVRGVSGGHKELSPLAPASGLVTNLLAGMQALLQLLSFLGNCENGRTTFMLANVLRGYRGIEYRNHLSAAYE